MLEQVAEKTIGPLLFELECTAARQSDKFDWVIEHGFNTNQVFDPMDDETFGQDVPGHPSFFEPFQSYDYGEVAERAVMANDAQMDSGFYLWAFSVGVAKF